jgi:hypothetical protein
MKRSLLYLSSFVLLGAMAYGSVSPVLYVDDGRKKKQAVPESGVVPMLVLSMGVIAGGLVLKQRRIRATV